MAFPVRSVTYPASLAGQQNGRLDSSVLEATAGLAGGPTVTLAEPAARAWRALTAAAKKAGHTLKAASTVDSYRPYAVQRSIFLARYRPLYKPNTDVKWWEGRRWYRWYGATAAAPGTSNHGWGLAVDTGEERDGDPSSESLDTGTLGWLLAHEQLYGFSHELQSEPWHIRYFTGDAIPAAVLAYEKNITPPKPDEQDDDDMPFIMLADGREPRLKDGPTFVPLDAPSLYAAGTVFKQVKVTTAHYDATREQVIRALDET